ncbi:MAG: chemotaxis protein CheD [Planctomycetaceae bacterium]|jgi:chemotaxis protein CheD|nr:chemotaxis protein CheD [Planctomycetaceae bacterium]
MLTETTGTSGKLMLGIGCLGATVTEGGVIKTMALGSCVAVMILDKRTRCIAMDHVALPDSSVSPDRAKQLPGYFADTGIPALFREIQRVAGSMSRPNDLIIKLAGGANIADPTNTFNIGKRNALAIKKILWQHGMGPVAEDLGGFHSRTVAVFRDAGKIVLSCPGKADWLL